MKAVDPRVIERIKKCLALAESDNPNEAAAALRQANVLMQKYGVSGHQVVMADIGESATRIGTMARDKPALWESHLANIIGKAFGCQMMISRTLRPKGFGHENDGHYVYVGLAQQAELAAYTASVLTRRCKKARDAWVKEHLSGLGRGVKGGRRKMTQMGDAFALGWVGRISKLVQEFAHPPEVAAAIKAYIDDARTPGAEGVPLRGEAPKSSEKSDMVAALHGMRAAEGESLHRPVQSRSPSRALRSM